MKQRAPRRPSNPPFRFTKDALDRLPVPEVGRATYRDDECHDLALDVRAGGGKSFYWFRKIRGRGPKYKTIGRFPEVSVESARDKADVFNGQLSEWKLAGCPAPGPFVEERREEPTLAELIEKFIQVRIPYAKNPQNAEKRLRQAAASYLGVPMPPPAPGDPPKKKIKRRPVAASAKWGARKLGAITKSDVRDLHAKMAERHPVAANRTVAMVKFLYNFAIDAELWKGENPARIRKLFRREKPRERFLDFEELARLFAAMRMAPHRDLVDFVNLSLFTGARKANVFAMAWADISLPDRRWTLRDTKNRKTYHVPITVEAEEILRARLALRQDGDPWVFPSPTSASGHLVDLKARWKELLERAKIDGLRIHDLRRTQGSWQAGAGVPLQVIGKSLGHSSTAATEIYARLSLDPVRAALSASNAAIAAARNAPLPARTAKRKTAKRLAAVNRG